MAEELGLGAKLLGDFAGRTGRAGAHAGMEARRHGRQVAGRRDADHRDRPGFHPGHAAAACGHDLAHRLGAGGAPPAGDRGIGRRRARPRLPRARNPQGGARRDPPRDGRGRQPASGAAPTAIPSASRASRWPARPAPRRCAGFPSANAEPACSRTTSVPGGSATTPFSSPMRRSTGRAMRSRWWWSMAARVPRSPRPSRGTSSWKRSAGIRWRRTRKPVSPGSIRPAGRVERWAACEWQPLRRGARSFRWAASCCSSTGPWSYFSASSPRSASACSIRPAAEAGTPGRCARSRASARRSPCCWWWR